MGVLDEGNKILRALRSLGRRRLMILGLVGVVTVGLIGAAGFMLSRPQYEVLYAGLDTHDAARIVGVMRELSVPFDVSADGATIYVEFGRAAQARMMLAERGMPKGASAGYELFDHLGSLGLTSFMQETTRIRALEGELVRSIETMQGVKSARVHLVLPDENSFRQRAKPGSASVIVKLATVDEGVVAQAIRHLVAAAAPGLTLGSITVLDTEGIVLAAGDDNTVQGSAQLAGFEKIVSERLRENIRRTLAPIVGARGMHVSVTAKVNTDKRETKETIYNPDGKVERSIRVVKENLMSRNSNTSTPASVDRNIPGDKEKSDGKQSNEENQKKEEVTNYEISAKSSEVTSSGGAIERLSVAIVIDRNALTRKAAGKDNEKNAEQRMVELTDLASTAAGLQKERGDVIKVVIAEFAESPSSVDASGAPDIAQLLLKQAGVAVNAFAVLAVVALVVVFGLRPMARSLASAPGLIPQAEPSLQQLSTVAQESVVDDSDNGRPKQIAEGGARASKRRLEKLIGEDETQAATILRQWVREAGQA